MRVVGGGRVHGTRELIMHMARRHAVDAARKRGPYLSPITFVAILALMTALGVALVRAAS